MPFISSVEEIGMEKGMREMVIEALAAKFPSVPENIKNSLLLIKDQNVLKQLLKKAILIENIDQFDAALG